MLLLVVIRTNFFKKMQLFFLVQPNNSNQTNPILNIESFWFRFIGKKILKSNQTNPIKFDQFEFIFHTNSIQTNPFTPPIIMCKFI